MRRNPSHMADACAFPCCSHLASRGTLPPAGLSASLAFAAATCRFPCYAACCRMVHYSHSTRPVVHPLALQDVSRGSILPYVSRWHVRFLGVHRCLGQAAIQTPACGGVLPDAHGLQFNAPRTYHRFPSFPGARGPLPPTSFWNGYLGRLSTPCRAFRQQRTRRDWHFGSAAACLPATWFRGLVRCQSHVSNPCGPVGRLGWTRISGTVGA